MSPRHSPGKLTLGEVSAFPGDIVPATFREWPAERGRESGSRALPLAPSPTSLSRQLPPSASEGPRMHVAPYGVSRSRGGTQSGARGAGRKLAGAGTRLAGRCSDCHGRTPTLTPTRTERSPVTRAAGEDTSRPPRNLRQRFLP